jgi:uncharacterized protein YjbI with pentapeptide repeats
MANPEHLAILKRGVEDWNHWREANKVVVPDLSGADLERANLQWGNFNDVNFKRARLNGANLAWAQLNSAHFRASDLQDADLSEATLTDAVCRQTDLCQAHLRNASLIRVMFVGAELCHADLSGALLNATSFVGTNLSHAKLLTCNHSGPSFLDYHTLTKSGELPLPFLRGCGLSDQFIEYLPALLQNAIHFESCFISYSTQDQQFAERLHADLQNKGVRCWFAPHDIRGGKKVYEQIDLAIQLHDRLLLILSESSINSEWVKTEIARARRREVKEKRHVLFPVRLVAFETLKNWEYFDSDTGKDSAREIREYFIPDFSNWKNHEDYQSAFKRLLDDLKANSHHG